MGPPVSMFAVTFFPSVIAVRSGRPMSEPEFCFLILHVAQFRVARKIVDHLTVQYPAYRFVTVTYPERHAIFCRSDSAVPRSVQLQICLEAHDCRNGIRES